jgi:fatty-acyl-CoA synthase
MACLRCDADFSLEKFTAYVRERLPAYQRPYFLRLLDGEMRVTGTFKHQKTDYRREGYDPAQMSDPLYFFDGERFETLDADLFEALQAGKVSLR